MDADTILRIRPALTQYLKEFDGCFGRINTQQRFACYVRGQLSDLRRKSIEPMADAAGLPPRNLQQLLSLFQWDEDDVRDRLQRRVSRRHHDSRSVGIIDETSFVKKGIKTAGVQRQHCGAVGKTENCVVSVHLGYATPDLHTLIDGELYLPEVTWHQDRQRCREARIPDEVVYRPKWQIALDQFKRALSNGLRFAWLTFDEGYGGKPPFLRELDALGQNYVAEIPKSFHVWTKCPDVVHREHASHRRPGRPRKVPRLRVQTLPRAAVSKLLAHSSILREVPWEPYRIKEGDKGPLVWEVKHLPIWLADESKLPTRPHHLLVARNALDRSEIKFFLSNAPQATSIQELLLVAFSRWKIEREFRDTKGELGLDQFEVRMYPCLKRHLIISCVSHLFLAEFRLGQRGEKSGAHDSPGPTGCLTAGADLAAERSLYANCR
jgi:SRSO17 transposase